MLLDLFNLVSHFLPSLLTFFSKFWSNLSLSFLLNTFLWKKRVMYSITCHVLIIYSYKATLNTHKINYPLHGVNHNEGNCITVYCIVFYYTILHCIVLYCFIMYCTIVYYDILNYIVLHYAILHCTVLFCAVLHCIVLYWAMMHCTVL